MSNFLKPLQDSLPVVEHVKLRTELDCYGISRIISQKLYLPFTPMSFANWVHGWLYVDLKYIEQFGLFSNNTYLVATKDQEDFFKARGKNAVAVGAPYVYAEDFDGVEVERQLNSLLVMPPHGLPFTEEEWDEETYVKQIHSLRDDFDIIIACVNSSCVEKNKWVVSFEKYDIPWVVGADMRDKNALLRMHRIFKSFEYMTTNCIGSHVAYAAYSGCKVSIYGDYAEFSKEDVKRDVLYINYPYVMEHNLFGSSKNVVSKKFPFLFTHPKMAGKLIDWSVDQLGAKNKKTFYQLATYIGWLPHQQIYFWAMKVYFKVKKETLLFFKK